MTDTPSSNPPSVWVLADDRAGNRSQCFGVADALRDATGFDYQVKNPTYGALASLPNFLLGASFAGVNADSRSQLSPPWPDLVIAAGRRTAPVARKIKRLAGQKCFLAQIMHPGGGMGDFGLIASPNHDGSFNFPNIISYTGAPHGLTAERLADEAKRWQGRFDDLAGPRIALIVGGTTRRRTFTDAMAVELGQQASTMATAAGGSLLVATSRRTGEAEAALLNAISAPKRVYRWGEEGQENPYLGYLACADAIIVTGDSVSMCSEACAGTGPVYIYAPRALITPKHARLHGELYEKGYARPLNSTLETWNHAPLNPAGDIATAIRERLGR
ncbi:MAG: mitochondrial fission ELM1 family protein [Proteobacteria bacterium]|nr:mitochondrial fission ELM1 family protein [Pseudomonadota bacterium]MDA1023766.1 mitochondrial fission ELM1 family protein [Pseudomonadota bacterium]